MERGDATRTVELCVASLHPSGAVSRQEEFIEALRALETAGQVDAVDVVVWGDRIGLGTLGAETSAGERVRDRLDACLEWEEAADRSLRPCFDVRQVDNRITDDAYTVIDLPSMLLVEYEDGEVRHVAPSTDGRTVETVAERIETLTADVNRDPSERPRRPEEVRSRGESSEERTALDSFRRFPAGCRPAARSPSRDRHRRPRRRAASTSNRALARFRRGGDESGRSHRGPRRSDPRLFRRSD